MSGPLDGIRVIDLSMLLPGPLCSQHLADLGADVIKIENPRVPDMTRYFDAQYATEGRPVSGEDSAMFRLLNRNKRSITLNVMRPEGKEILLKLLEDADVLLEGFRPGKMEELGLGYKDLRERFPRLIYCAISGYGDGGPLRDFAGHDGNYIARAGVLGLTGAADPVVPGIQIADIAGGTLIALSGILAALVARSRTGRGQFVDVSMLDGAFSLMPLQAAEFIATKKNPARGQMPLSGGLANYAVYRTADGRHVMLGSLEERFFRAFLRAAGREDLASHLDAEQIGFLRKELTELFASRTLAEWAPLFENTEACLAPVHTVEEAFHDPQLQARGMIRHVSAHGREWLEIGSPFKFSETPVELDRRPAPGHGMHTREVLSGLGFSDLDIEDLKKKRIL